MAKKKKGIDVALSECLHWR